MADSVDIFGLLHNMPAHCVPEYVQALQRKILDIEKKKQVGAARNRHQP